MTMMKQAKTSIWTYAADGRDVDDLIFANDETNAQMEAPCSDR